MNTDPKFNARPLFASSVLTGVALPFLSTENSIPVSISLPFSSGMISVWVLPLLFFLNLPPVEAIS